MWVKLHVLYVVGVRSGIEGCDVFFHYGVLVLMSPCQVAVNAQLVPTEDFAAATALIQAAPWPLTLRFRRPPPGAPLARPLTGAAAEAAWTAALRSPGPDGDARRAAAVRSVALGGGTGGELVLLSVQVCVKIDFFNEKKKYTHS
jgi:hypothetical protein